MSNKAVDGEIVLAVNHSNVEAIIHQILDNPMRNAPLYLGEMFDDNVKIVAERLETVAQEYRTKRKNPAALLSRKEEQEYQLKMVNILEEARDMVQTTAQIGQAILVAMKNHDFGLQDNQAFALHNMVRGTIVRCAEPLSNINARQQEIISRGLIKPHYAPIRKGPKMG
jgi:hypothetical protein